MREIEQVQGCKKRKDLGSSAKKTIPEKHTVHIHICLYNIEGKTYHKNNNLSKKQWYSSLINFYSHNILLTSRDFNLLIFLHRILSEASSQLWFLWALLGSVAH